LLIRGSSYGDAGPEAAVEIVFAKDIDSATDSAARRAELIGKYRQEFANPYVAAERRQANDIVEPACTRAYLIRALESLQTKRQTRPPKKHGLIPL
jgi:methylmalonyl-CoA carboxyltransferase large subunit